MDLYGKIKKEELGVGSSIKLQVVDTEEDIYYDMAQEMFAEIKKNNEIGKATVFICPVGPVGQYRKFARMVNTYRLSLKNVYIFNMDEYLDENKEPISINNPLSFKGIMKRELYSRIEEELTVPIENRFFPEPGRENYIWDRINEIGGVDICFGGIGINGHIAFNEPPEENESITEEEFKKLPTRVLRISKETKIANAITALKGHIDGMPDWCITIGMKEILSARKLRFYLIRQWQSGIVRKVLHGPITARVPASFLQEHKDVKLVITNYVAEQPVQE